MGTSRSRSSLFFILIVLACSSQWINGLKILGLFPLHGKSHFIMCERLLIELAKRGHQVDVYSHFPQKQPIQNYTDYSLADTMPTIVNNMGYDMMKKFEKVNMEALVRLVGGEACKLMDTKVFQDLFKKLKQHQPYDIVIVELFMSNCYIAWGRYLKIPLVGIMTSSIIDWYNEPLGNEHNLAAIPSSWSHYIYPMNFWERLNNFYIYHGTTAKYKYHVSSQNEYVEKFFGPGYPDATELIKDVDLLLLNTHYSIDGIRAYTPAIIPVAGLHITEDNSKLPLDVQKWLEESKHGCIYISFGSMVRIETFPKEILDAFYKTFENIAPVRVLMKIAKPVELPPGLPSNVMTQSWFPQQQVLRHKNLKAFVTHGGLGSIQESLAAGVPLVGIPLYGDQYINIKSQVQRKVATTINLYDIKEDTLTSTIKEVLNNPEYKKNAEKFAKTFFDRPMSPVDTAVFWVEYIARHGKGALRSPLVDMPWWQANLVDVYGFIFLILFSICFTVRLVVKKLFTYYFSLTNKIKKE